MDSLTISGVKLILLSCSNDENREASNSWFCMMLGIEINAIESNIQDSRKNLDFAVLSIMDI